MKNNYYDKRCQPKGDYWYFIFQDGTYLSSPFHVRFGKYGVLKAKEKIVSFSHLIASLDRCKVSEIRYLKHKWFQLNWFKLGKMPENYIVPYTNFHSFHDFSLSGLAPN